jgi:hypothetical protein
MMKNVNFPTSHLCRKELAPSQSGKGKGAFSTENRRVTWDFVIWPMLLYLNRPYFTLEEFRIKRTEICRKYRINGSNIRGGLVSLTYRGFLINNHHTYSINFKLLLYLSKKVNLDYSKAFRKMVAKH